VSVEGLEFVELVLDFSPDPFSLDPELFSEVAAAESVVGDPFEVVDFLPDSRLSVR